MATYDNPTGISPLLPQAGIPGITLPEDFNLEAADRGMVPGSVEAKPKKTTFIQPSPVKFPSRDPAVYGDGISRLIGAFSGPGFNLIFRPHTDKTGDRKVGDDLKPKFKMPAIGDLEDDLLELNLTHEIWTFPRADLGEIPNRVAAGGKDAILSGIPYTQIVREVTDPDEGTRVQVDRLGKCGDKKKKALVSDIHFEPGLLIHVPHSSPVSGEATISRMASIPHGTTINAQGAKAVKIDGKLDIPPFSDTASQPFFVNNDGPAHFFDHNQFDLGKNDATRLPQDMSNFLAKESITKRMTQDPNELLRIHNVGKSFDPKIPFVKFTVSTTPSQALEKQSCPHLTARRVMDATKDKTLKEIDAQIEAAASKEVKAALAETKLAITKTIELCGEPTRIAGGKATAPAIGTSNIAFLDGTSAEGPNARTGRVESTFWISTVVYTLNVAKDFKPTKDADGKVTMKDGEAVNFLRLEPEEKSQVDAAGKKKFVEDTIPTFVFPADKPVAAGRYSVTTTQIQYSQTVNLIFNNLVWPHISVATLVPVRPVVVKFATKLPN